MQRNTLILDYENKPQKIIQPCPQTRIMSAALIATTPYKFPSLMLTNRKHSLNARNLARAIPRLFVKRNYQINSGDNVCSVSSRWRNDMSIDV